MLSDLYALGVTECDNMLMLLAVAQKMTEKERDVVVPLILRGFKVRCHGCTLLPDISDFIIEGISKPLLNIQET